MKIILGILIGTVHGIASNVVSSFIMPNTKIAKRVAWSALVGLVVISISVALLSDSGVPTTNPVEPALRITEPPTRAIVISTTASHQAQPIAPQALPPIASVSLTPTPKSPATIAPSLELPIPANYIVFDNFGGIGTPDTSRWGIDGRLDKCNEKQGNDQLKIQREMASGDVNLMLWPLRESEKVARGVAIASNVLIDDYLGSMDTHITFDGADGNERVYFLQLRYAEFKVVEAYPQNDWQSIDLAKVAITPLQPHVVQVKF